MANITRVERVFVGGSDVSSATKLSELKEGEIGVFGLDQQAITAANVATFTGNAFYVATATKGDIPLISSEIKLKDLINYRKQDFVPSNPQTFLIGQTGTGTLSGLVFSEETTYGLRVYLKDNHRLIGTRPTMYHAHYTTPKESDGDTEYSNTKKVMFGLQTLIHGEEYGHGFLKDYVKVLVSTDATGTDTTFTTTTATTKYGADVVIFQEQVFLI